MTVTIVVPISRDSFVERLFHSLEVMECKKEDVNLLVIVDGGVDLFIKCRNFVEMSKFAQRLCIQFKSTEKMSQYDILARRLRISAIHNEARKHMWDCDYVFGLEDDTVAPTDSIKKLLRQYALNPYAGFIEGVQIGRWGVPYVGAWKVDDIYEPTTVTSLLPISSLDSTRGNTGVEPIDAGGFYCFMTRAKSYLDHEFKPFENNSLGPDVDFGVTLRREGLINYIDWSIQTSHRTPEKDIGLHNTEPRVLVMSKVQGQWRQGNSKL